MDTSAGNGRGPTSNYAVGGNWAFAFLPGSVCSPQKRTKMNAQHTDPGRIDPDHYETSPSCGSFEVAAIYGCPDAHAVEADTDSHPDAVHLEDTAMFHESSFSLEVAQ